MFQKPALFQFEDKNSPNLVDHLDWLILKHWAPQKHKLVKICTWEQF